MQTATVTNEVLKLYLKYELTMNKWLCATINPTASKSGQNFYIFINILLKFNDKVELLHNIHISITLLCVFQMLKYPLLKHRNKTVIYSINISTN